MDKYTYYYCGDGITREFNSAEDCAEFAKVSRWDVINGCLGRSKTTQYNNWFYR